MIAFPAIAFVVSLACGVLVAADGARRPKPDKVAWAISFGLFAVAAGAEVVGSLAGWNPLLVRLYYLTGAILVVGFLGLGQLYLLFGKKIARVAPGAALLATALAATFVMDAPVDEARLTTDGWHALERGPALVALTVSINALGTIVVVGGALWSAWTFWRNGIFRRRMVGCLLIALGTLVVAAGGSLTRLGSPQFLYVAMAAGVGLIFAGYLQARRPDGAAKPAGAPEGVAGPSLAVGDPHPRRTPPPRSPVVSLPGGRAARPEPAVPDPGIALIAAWLAAADGAAVSALCAEWSVPADAAPVLDRADARRVWGLRLRLPAGSHAAFDALPVPARRQLATLADEVFLAADADGRAREAG